MRDEEIAEAWDRADPALESVEKETTIRWAKPDDEAVIHTDEAGVGRRLVVHPDSAVESVNVLRADDTRTTLSPEDVHENDEVVGVRLRLPVAAVSIKSGARKSDQHSAVVSQAVMSDGGRYQLPGVGDRVRDREDDDELVVLDVNPEERAGDHVIPGLDGLTVADVNQPYDADAPTVEAVYADEAEAALDGWRSVEDLRDAVALDAITPYTFPADRLAVTDDDSREHVADGGVVECGDIEVGAVVEDREDSPATDRMVVINTPPLDASEWQTNPHGVTVADENRDYDSHDDVAVCVFADDLAEARPEYDGDRPLEIAELAIYSKAYPVGRLRRVGEVDQ